VLEWDLPAKHLQNGEIVMYQLLYHKLADSINTEDLNITGLLYEVKGLEMNTDYVFQIRAFTSRGAGPWSPRYMHHTYGRSKKLTFIFNQIHDLKSVEMVIFLKLSCKGSLFWNHKVNLCIKTCFICSARQTAECCS
jgi:hypothetical protein